MSLCTIYIVFVLNTYKLSIHKPWDHLKSLTNGVGETVQCFECIQKCTRNVFILGPIVPCYLLIRAYIWTSVSTKFWHSGTRLTTWKDFKSLLHYYKIFDHHRNVSFCSHLVYRENTLWIICRLLTVKRREKKERYFNKKRDVKSRNRCRTNLLIIMTIMTVVKRMTALF